jgi:hypothetical protein
MTIRVLLPLIVASFVYGGSVVAQVRQPKTPLSPAKPAVTQKKVSTAPKKPTVTQKKVSTAPKKPTVTQKKPTVTLKKPATTTKKTTVVKVVQPKWKTFTPPDRSFTVLMPGKPKQETQIQKTYLGEINLNLFVAQPPKQEVAYLVSYNEFPFNYAEMNTPEEILKKAEYNTIKTTQSRVVNERKIRSSNGHPGKEIEYVDASGKVTKTRMYFAQGRLYQVTAIVSKKQQKTLAKTINGYLNSFQLVLKR